MKVTTKGVGGFFISVSRKEAVELIRSMSQQIIENDSNVGRLESQTDKGKYFTISVIPEKEQTEAIHKLLHACRHASARAYFEKDDTIGELVREAIKYAEEV